AGIVLANPENRLFCHSVKFLFPATNNEAEYEALLSVLDLAGSMNVKQLKVFSDSQLLVNQINGSYEVKEPRLTPYLALAKKKLSKFAAEVEHIPRTLNVQADALSRLASSTGMESMEYVQVGQQEQPSTCLSEVTVLDPATSQNSPTWMDPIIRYLETGALPANPKEARALRIRAARYTLDNGILFKRGYSTPLLKCVNESDSRYILEEFHEGVCGSHPGAQALSYKVLRQGYYWPTLKTDAAAWVRKCPKCQIFGPNIHRSPEELKSIYSTWPFAQWGIDLIGPLPTRKGGVRFAIVAVDYFTKWAEAEPLATITEQK
ncbi:RNase H family protein, partial [Striga hermonthica]